MVKKHKCKEWVIFQFSNVNVPSDTVLKFDTSANATLWLTLSLNWPFLLKVYQFCTSQCLSRITLTTVVYIVSLKPKYHQWFVFNCAGLVNEDTDVTASLWGSRYEWTGKSRRFISKWNYYSNSSFKLSFSTRKRFDFFPVRKKLSEEKLINTSKFVGKSFSDFINSCWQIVTTLPEVRVNIQ